MCVTEPHFQKGGFIPVEKKNLTWNTNEVLRFLFSPKLRNSSSAKQTAVLSALNSHLHLGSLTTSSERHYGVFFLPWFLLRIHHVAQNLEKAKSQRADGFGFWLVFHMEVGWRSNSSYFQDPAEYCSQGERTAYLPPLLATYGRHHTQSNFPAEALQSVLGTGWHRNSSNSNPWIHEFI